MCSTHALSLKRVDLRGPWKPTVEEAIIAFRDMRVNKGLYGKYVYQLAIVERASCKDNRGNYKKVEIDNFDKKLSDAGILIDK